MDTANQYVKLNVGGALFHTTLGTLLKYDSMFKAMFSGRNEVFRDSDGYVPIDRCGKHFGLILNFMRDGTVPLPDCRTEVQEIIIEAKFYLIQELVSLCESWFINMEKAQVEPIGVCQVPVVMSKKQVERIWQSSTGRPVIELLLNRNNNKYSYNTSSDENFLRNQELFDKLLLRFNSSKNNNVLFIKNLGIGSPEICQWTFYGNASRKVEISCTSIVYTPEKKQTKVEFPEARIYEETLNALLTFGGCTHCKNDDPSIQQKPSSTESARRGLGQIVLLPAKNTWRIGGRNLSGVDDNTNDQGGGPSVSGHNSHNNQQICGKGNNNDEESG
ncbi:unnamed protein product [Meloidogyne enterolobii]|uniref:BTB domain-containing protein n=6 Tax=Meloidogyne TaxID=189290 RepID=A0A6V7U0I8_MELEN|nr:unnamed protein product [Meloidogyne enterolobii]CAD2190768.1 unnamed protein product [Meloidogyne enterolobii]